ncbi:MAG: tyrosine-type recombinase/integrase [Spirulina sp.]
MYSTQDNTKIGKVKIDFFTKKDGKYIRLRFTYPKGKRNEIALGKATEETHNEAIAIATQINRDIALDNFDFSLVRYDKNHQSHVLEVIEKEKDPTVKELWELYKGKEKNKSAITTQENTWKEIDRFLDKLPKESLLLRNIDSLGDESLKVCAVTSAFRYFSTLQAAIRQYKGYEQIDIKKQLPKIPKKPIEWFEPNEVKKILQAIKDNRFNPNSSRYKHNFYYPYACFCAYTGCRPQEAIALTWNDIHWNEDKTKCQVKINKAYRKGVLKVTKNHQIRLIPISDKLTEILKEHQSKSSFNNNNLVFPSYEGKYLNIDNYNRNIWKPILSELVKQKEISKYLKPYCLRHSFVTNLHYNHHISFGVIAGLIGDKLQTVIDYYTGLKPFDAGKMPDIY